MLNKLSTGLFQPIDKGQLINDCNVLIIGICYFDIVCYLSIVIWDFSAVSEMANRFYLNQIELTLTFPCVWFLSN